MAVGVSMLGITLVGAGLIYRRKTRVSPTPLPPTIEASSFVNEAGKKIVFFFIVAWY